MPRITDHLVALVAAFLIMAGSFGAVVSVPPAQASYAIVAPALA